MYHQNVDILLPLCHLIDDTLTEQWKYTVENIKKCRTPEKGGRILRCPDCNTTMVVYNPCNKRGCPICYRKNQLQWQKKAERRILPGKHYHLTFSIPDSYTSVWLHNKKEVMDSLFQAAKEAIQIIAHDSGLLVGSLLVFQSHARQMSYKPHVHCVLSSGGLDEKKQWRELDNIPLRKMELTTQQAFIREIRSRMPIKQVTTDTSRSHKQFRIFLRIHEGSGKNILAYLAKSRNGVVIDLEQNLRSVGDTIEFKELHSTGEQCSQLTNKVFIERFLNHIPMEGSVTTRYYGLYSNRHKKDFRIAEEQVRTENDIQVTPYIELCPRCKHEMIVVEVITSADSDTFLKYGSEQGPPKHREILCVA